MYLPLHKKNNKSKLVKAGKSKRYHLLCCPHNTYKCQKYSKINWSSPLLKSSWLSPAPVQRTDSHSVVSQGRASSQATSTQGAWHEASSSLREASRWLHQAVVLSGTPGEGLGGGSQSAPRPRPSSLASPRVIAKRTSEHLYDAVSDDQGTDALGALWFQAHRKPLDTKIPWGGGIHRATPVACLAPLCPAVLYFCLLTQGWCSSSGGILPGASCFPFPRPGSFFSPPSKVLKQNRVAMNMGLEG